MSEGWIHSFAVTDTQTHKNGYTIYKITSIVFPRAIPQALTCITVWKRFHDIKRLHKEISRRKKLLKISGEMPEPTDSTYFKRFDTDVIERRKEFIIRFLDFIAQHPLLYKCHVFFQFFSDTSSPNDSPLHKLHAEKSNKVLSLLDENVVTKVDEKIDDSLVDISAKATEESPKKEPQQEDSHLEKENVDVSLPTTTADAELQAEAISEKKPARDYTRFLTPMASIETEDSDYIYEAALEFSRAVQAEANLEYSEAHMRYKRGVEVLLNGSKDDTNEERRFIAKTKITKYLARADDIFQKFLSGDDETDGNESNVGGSTSGKLKVQLSVEGETIEEIHSSYYIERPLNQLAKYKVIRILGDSVIQVQCITDRHRPTYVIKGIEKPPSSAPTQTIFLPQHIPYMVELVSFFQSDEKIYLLLRYAEAGRLVDYIKNYEIKTEKHTNLEEIFSTLDTHSQGNENRTETETPDGKTDHNEFLRSSQRLLETVSSTLNEATNQIEFDSTIPKNDEAASIKLKNLPEASIKQWARELLVAIESLHEKGVTLFDLHINNLMLGEKGQLLLTYFYQNQPFNEEPRNLYAFSQHCVAPERPLTFKSDWWSYGVILYQLLLGTPFKTLHPGRIEIYGFVQYPDNIELSDCGRDLLENLLTHSPEDRFDVEQIRDHDFFKGTNWNEVRRNGINSTAKAL